MARAAGYNLIQPDHRAYDPNQQQIYYAQAMAHPHANPGSFLGSAFAADVNARNARDQYQQALADTNRQQYDLGLRSIAQQDMESRRNFVGTNLANPGQSAAFELSRAEISPDALPHMAQMAVADLERVRADAYHKRGQGYKLFSDAGVSAPAGASFDPTFGTTASAGAQGTRPDITIAGINLQGDLAKARGAAAGAAGVKHQTTLGLLKQYQDIDENINNRTEQAVNALIAANKPLIGADNTIIQPAPYTPEQLQAKIAETRTRGREHARQQQETLRSMAERGGMGGVLPPRVDYSMEAPKLHKPRAEGDNTGGNKSAPATPSPSLAQAAIPQGPATQALPTAGTGQQTAGTHGGPPMTVGGGAPNQRAATPAPTNNTLDGQLRTIAGIANTQPVLAHVAKELTRRGLPPDAEVAVTREKRVAIRGPDGRVLDTIDIPGVSPPRQVTR